MRAKLADIFFGDRRRKDYGVIELQELAADFKENGQITAITIRPASDFDRAHAEYKNEPWALVAGGRRYMAAKLAGWEDIEAFAREELSELVHRVLELHENLKRKPMSWDEELEAKKEILRLRRIENPDITLAEVAKELGESTATFSRDVATAEAIEANPQLKKTGSKHAARGAAKLLEEHKDRERQAALAEEIPNAADLTLEQRVITGDALQYVAGLEESSIDLALLDGPYGYNYWLQGHKPRPGVDTHISLYDDSPDKTEELYRALLPGLVRSIRKTGWLVMFCGTETFILLQQLARSFCVTHGVYGEHSGEYCKRLVPEPYPWIWHRPNSRNQPRHPHLHAKNVAELIFVCNMGKGRIVKHPAHSVLVHEVEYGTIRIHTNQKPMPLYAELIERLTFMGDSVLDCFFGSGNSLAAAASLGRVPYGCDSNPNMLPFALGRIRANLRPITKADIAGSLLRYRMGLEGEEATPLEAEEQEWMPGLLDSASPTFDANSGKGEDVYLTEEERELTRKRRLTGKV